MKHMNTLSLGLALCLGVLGFTGCGQPQSDPESAESRKSHFSSFIQETPGCKVGEGPTECLKRLCNSAEWSAGRPYFDEKSQECDCAHGFPTTAGSELACAAVEIEPLLGFVATYATREGKLRKAIASADSDYLDSIRSWLAEHKIATFSFELPIYGIGRIDAGHLGYKDPRFPESDYRSQVVGKPYTPELWGEQCSRVVLFESDPSLLLHSLGGREVNSVGLDYDYKKAKAFAGIEDPRESEGKVAPVLAALYRQFKAEDARFTVDTSYSPYDSQCASYCVLSQRMTSPDARWEASYVKTYQLGAVSSRVLMLRDIVTKQVAGVVELNPAETVSLLRTYSADRETIYNRSWRVLKSLPLNRPELPGGDLFHRLSGVFHE